MIKGRTLEEVAAQVIEESKAKKDYVAPTDRLTMLEDTNVEFDVGDTRHRFEPSTTAIRQISDRAGIPAKYAERMRQEAPGLLARNVNHWWTAKPEKRMLRTFGNGRSEMRAFLSDRYRPLDNYDLMNAVLPTFQDMEMNIQSIEVTERRLYIQVVTPKLESVIKQAKQQGGHMPMQRAVQAGIVISNSEIGYGAISVDPMIYELVCSNGLIIGRTLKRHHVGKRNDGGLEGDDATFEMFTDKTRELNDKAFWSKVRDVVSGSLTEDVFHQNVAKLQETTEQELPGKVQDIVEVTSERFNFNEDEKDSLLQHLAAGGDFTKYGLIQAVTRTAEDVESYDRAVELERLGGQIIELPAKEWK